MYAAEWPCCHDPLRFSLGSDDLSPQRGNPTRRTPNALARSPTSSRLALLPRASSSGRRRAHPHAAARAWREGLCVSRTRPSRSLRPSSRIRLLEAFRIEKGLSLIKVRFVSIIAFERLNASFEPYSMI